MPSAEAANAFKEEDTSASCLLRNIRAPTLCSSPQGQAISTVRLSTMKMPGLPARHDSFLPQGADEDFLHLWPIRPISHRDTAPLLMQRNTLTHVAWLQVYVYMLNIGKPGKHPMQVKVIVKAYPGRQAAWRWDVRAGACIRNDEQLGDTITLTALDVHGNPTGDFDLISAPGGQIVRIDHQSGRAAQVHLSFVSAGCVVCFQCSVCHAFRFA